MKTQATARLVAFALSALLTFGMLSSVNALATSDVSPNALLAQTCSLQRGA